MGCSEILAMANFSLARLFSWTALAGHRALFKPTGHVIMKRIISIVEIVNHILRRTEGGDKVSSTGGAVLPTPKTPPAGTTSRFPREVRAWAF
jgi:hypothetical protein